MFQVLGLEGVYRWFEYQAEQMIETKGCAENIFKSELANNIIDDINDYEEMNGFKFYQYNSFDGEEGWSIEDNIRRQHIDYMHERWQMRLNNYDSYAHNAFMDGNEVLS